MLFWYLDQLFWHFSILPYLWWSCCFTTSAYMLFSKNITLNTFSVFFNDNITLYDWPDFSLLVYERPHFSDIFVYAHIFPWGIFWGCLSHCLFNKLSNHHRSFNLPLGVPSCPIVQYMNRSPFCTIKYTNGLFLSKARYINWVGFKILASTPISQLPSRYQPSHTRWAFVTWAPLFPALYVTCILKFRCSPVFQAENERGKMDHGLG